MKTGPVIAIAAVSVAVIAIGAYMIDFDVTDEGSMPEVSVEGGELPEVDAEVGTVETGTTTETVEVPDVDVDVDTEEKQIELPTVEVNPPSDND